MPAIVAAGFVTFYNLTLRVDYSGLRILRNAFFSLGFKWAYHVAIGLLGFRSETALFMKNGKRGFWLSWRRRRMHLALALAMALCTSSFVRICPASECSFCGFSLAAS